MDQIADLLTRIKNSTALDKKSIVVSHSKTKAAILEILKQEGFIQSVNVAEESGRKSVTVNFSNKKSITHLRQISKPGLRVYTKSKEIPKPLHGLGTVIISTSAGITTGRSAIKSGLGGELICEIW